MVLHERYRLTRRALLGGTMGLAGVALLTACGGQATATPPSAATTAPAPTSAGAAVPTSAAGSATAVATARATAGSASPAASPVTSPAAAAGPVKDTIKVGIVTSKSGPLQSYGEQYLEGLDLGLSYATKGTGVVNGHKIEWTIKDDAGDPGTGVAAAKDLIGQGYKLLAGSVVSGVGLQVAPLAEQNQVLFISGPAATDGLTGINRYTFRSGRQSYQDVLTAKSFLADPKGKAVLVFAQDTAFGQSNVAAVKAVFGADGATVDQLLVPQDAKDFAPFAQQALNKKPDLIFVAWAGTTATAMWNALDSQGVLTSLKVVTGLDQRATYPIFGPAADKIAFLSHYIYQAPKNPVNDWLVAEMKKRNKVPDLFTPDGFVGAQLIVRAIETADGTNVDKLIQALEGYSFTGPKGDYTIRKEDHATLQPMFQVKLVKQGDSFDAQLVTTVPPDKVAPPVKKAW